MKNKTLMTAAAAAVLCLVWSEGFGGIVNAQSSEEEKYADAPAPVLASGTMPGDYSTESVPFKTEIDEFYRQVKEMPIPEEEKGGYDHCKEEGYSVRKLEIDGIPLYEVKKDDGRLKPLVIQIHGGGWHKDMWTAFEMAEEGVCTVSIDCAGSGESQDGPLQAPAAWMETVKDIDVLIEYYNTISDVDAKNFGLTGFSMGGNISELYTIYGKYKPTAICIENASADTTHEGSSWDCFNKGQNGLTPIWEEEEMWDFTSAIAPIKHTRCFKDIWLYICVGDLDDVHSPDKMEEFKDAVAALGNDKIVFRRFEGVEHEVTQSWIDNERKDFFARMLSPTDDPAPDASDTEAASTSPAPADTEPDVTANVTAVAASDTAADAAGNTQKPAENDKGSPNTGVSGAAAVAGIAVITAGSIFVSKKRK